VLLSVNVRYLELVGSVAAFVDTVSRGVGVVLLLGWLLGKARDILACMEAVWSKLESLHSLEAVTLSAYTHRHGSSIVLIAYT
jgi:hypothetical protein